MTPTFPDYSINNKNNNNEKANLIITSKDVWKDSNKREGDEGDDGQSPGQNDHEDNVANDLHEATKAYVEICSKRVTHYGRVWCQARCYRTCVNIGRNGQMRLSICYHSVLVTL